MKKKLSNKTLSRWILMLLMLVTGTTQGVAQNVTIDLVHGSLLAAVTDENESGFAQGYRSLWRHEQLALSMTGTDRDGLTTSGEVLEPSAVFGQRNGKITIVGGRRPSYIVVSLPKGYRITGYTLVLANDLVGANSNVGTGNFASINDNDEPLNNGQTATMRFYETKKWTDNETNSGHASRTGCDNTGYNANQVRYIELGTNWQNGQIGQTQSDILATATADDGDTDINPSDAGKKYTISRTSQSPDDMGNQIYFRLVKNYCFYGLTIESFEIRFTAEGTFTANVKPTEASDVAVSMDASPFKTNKIDIGEMKNHTQPGSNNQAFSYTWEEVKDLDAFNYIYQDDALKTDASLGGKVPADVATTKNIHKVNNGGNLYYGLKSDIYFVEPPIEIENSAGNMVPIGYRIVGGAINYALGSEDYFIQLYDRTGAKITTADGLIEVNSSNATGRKDLGILNNDAIKFEILRKNANDELVPFSENGMAFITVDLYLQALNPYIDKMDIVCHDDRDVLQLTQTFTADNFSVAGDRFIFYVPADYGNEDLNFTFSGLYSKYGDETYYNGGEGAARYSFVRSPYFITVDGDGDGGLYNNSAYSADHTYTDKVYTVDAGKYRFKFNNAEDLAAAGNNATGTFTEYPFSVKKYLDTKNPGDPTAYVPIAASEDKGEFIECVLNASKENQKSGTYYVFTADETRWNIAPTDGWQHRYYAFYRMEIELVAKTFSPKLDFTKIYDKTLYNDGTPDDKEDSMWGLTLDVTDTDNTGQKVTGYLTYQEIIDNIIGRDETLWAADDPHLPNEAAIGTVKYSAIASKLDNTNTDAPADIKQILYIDGTPLYAMLNSSQYSDVKTLEDLKELLNPNALVFLPENTTSTLNNVAYETKSTSSTRGLQAGKDIVLTDKIPFYTPYDIQVDAANKATYTRVLTQPDYGQAVNATIMLPFTLKLDDNGLHANEDGSCSFTVNTMKDNAQMATIEGSNVNYGTAYFKPLTGSTEANKPYVIHVESIAESASEGNTISFIATQKGSSIVKSPEVVTVPGFSGKLIEGAETQAKYNSVDYNFKNYASYSGGKFDRAVSENVFYFSKNKYVDLHTLYVDPNDVETWRYLMSYPFRGVYTYSASGSGAKMNGFYISYDLDEMESATTGLEGLGTKADMMIRSGRGFITITATTDQKFAIRTLNGMIIKNVSVSGGNTTTVSLPAGIYIVNNTKITVK